MKTPDSRVDSTMGLLIAVILTFSVLWLPAPSSAAAQAGSSGDADVQASSAAEPMPPVDYSDPAAWLCRPGRDDLCAVDLDATVVRADGSTSVEEWSADPDAPVDCFYVYPTVSTDASDHSDMTPDAAERRVIASQFARFQSVCRPFAPMYRQVTLAGLRSALAQGRDPGLASGTEYDDVRDAFRHYLENDNDGRPFVLVGHSQGSFVLARLIREEIEGTPVADRMVSAILAGTTISVPEGWEVGGTFESTPLCRSATQTGCVITFATFRSTVPPPENTRFGAVDEAGMAAACTNPAALTGETGASGGSGGPGGSAALRPYFQTEGSGTVGERGADSWAEGTTVETPWVTTPGLVTARCASNDFATYLEITIHADPADPRTDEISGDLTPDWGLHLVDVALTQGSLIEVVERQTEAFLAGR